MPTTSPHSSAPPPGPVTGRFLLGIMAPWRGWEFLRDHPPLWRYAIWPLLINLLITLVVFGLLVGGAVYAIFQLFAWADSVQTSGWQRPGLMAIVLLASVGLLVGCVVLAAILWRLLSGILCGYFYGLLAEQVERTLGANREELPGVSWRQETGDALRDTGQLVAAQLTLLLVGLIPFAGPPLGGAIGLLWTWSILGRDCVTHSLLARGWTRRQRRELVQRRRAETLGLGAAVSLLQFVPIIGAVFLTTAVVGGTLMCRDWLKSR